MIERTSMVAVRCLARCDKYMEGFVYVMQREFAEMLITSMPQAFRYDKEP